MIIYIDIIDAHQKPPETNKLFRLKDKENKTRK